MKTTCVGLQGQQGTVDMNAGLLTSILKVTVALLLQCDTLFSTLLKDTNTQQPRLELTKPDYRKDCLLQTGTPLTKAKT